MMILHDLQSRWFRGTFPYLPVLINKSLDDVLMRDDATLYLFSMGI